MISTDYKGRTIVFNEMSEEWTLVIEGKTVNSNKRLIELERWIDELDKAEKKKDFVRFEVYVKTWEDLIPFEKATVTSVVGNEFWVTKPAPKGRAKDKTVYRVDPENDTIVDKITANRKLIKTLQKEESELFSQLKTVTTEG